MANRSAYNLPGLAPAGAVAPDLVKSGKLFFTSGIRGVDRATGELPNDPGEQFLNAWHNLAALVEGAGLSTDNIGLVTNFIDSQDYRAHINTGWLEVFPSRDDRPARKTTSFPLATGIGAGSIASSAKRPGTPTTWLCCSPNWLPPSWPPAPRWFGPSMTPSAANED